MKLLLILTLSVFTLNFSSFAETGDQVGSVFAACEKVPKEFKKMCLENCKDLDSEESLTQCIAYFSKEPNKGKSRPVNNLARQACSKVDEEHKAKCISHCSRRSSAKSVQRCVKLYLSDYTWVDDAENRKIISSSVACGGSKVCIGNVRYTNADGQEVTRLAVCDSENCGDDDATRCARQAGFGSQSVSEYHNKKQFQHSSKKEQSKASSASNQ